MEHFSYSLFLSLIHSTWQAALLVCLYSIVNVFIKRTNPVIKRNMLFLFLVIQILTTISTLIFYYSGSSFFDVAYFVNTMNDLLIVQPTIAIIAPWLTIVYFVVITFKTTQLIVQWGKFKYIGRSAWIKPPIDLKLFCIVKANEFGIQKKVILWYSNAIHTPLTFGFLKPVILLPVALVNNLSMAETESLIIHELSHIKSNDYFFNWLLIISETVFFFNPFILIIINRIRLEREKNCDASVLQFNYSAISYAETLLKAARFKTTAAPFFLAAAFKNAQLIKRVRFFTEENNLRFYKKNYRAVAFLPVVCLFFTCVYFINLINIKPVERFTKNVQQDFKVNNINDGFPKAILPVSKLDYPVMKISNDAAGKIKIDQGHLNMNNSDIELNHEIVKQHTAFEELALSVALPEEETTREVILKEENSASGKSTTKVYKMQLVKGKWKATLLWTISESRPLYDSLLLLRDTIGFNNLSQ